MDLPESLEGQDCEEVEENGGDNDVKMREEEEEEEEEQGDDDVDDDGVEGEEVDEHEDDGIDEDEAVEEGELSNLKMDICNETASTSEGNLIDDTGGKQSPEPQSSAAGPSRSKPLSNDSSEDDRKKRSKKKKKKKKHCSDSTERAHKSKHKQGCKTRHKHKHKHHRKHKHKHSSCPSSSSSEETIQMVIKESTVSLEDDGKNEKRPLRTKIGIPSEPSSSKTKVSRIKASRTQVNETQAMETEATETQAIETQVTKKRITETEEAEASSSSSVQTNKATIPAFLPAEHIMWKGVAIKTSTRTRGPKKITYKSIRRGSEVLKIGDSAVFVSQTKQDRPFIGRITDLWCTTNKALKVKVFWFYHPEEIVEQEKLISNKIIKVNVPFAGGLFSSKHADRNDVQTISHKCNVISLAEFKQKAQKNGFIENIYLNNDTFYIAGGYRTGRNVIDYEPGVE